MKQLTYVLSTFFIIGWFSICTAVAQESAVAESPAEAENAEAKSPEAHSTDRMTPELLWKLGRLSGAALSGDDAVVAYTVKHYQLDENSGSITLYAQPFSGEIAPRTLLEGWSTISELQFAMTPFGERLYFIGKPDVDDESVVPQAYVINVQDGAWRQVTHLEDGVANLKVSPTGRHLAFTSDVELDDDIHKTYEDLPDADARIIDSLMYRHWSAWHDYKYTHLHVAAINDQGVAEEPVDLMEGMRVDCPVPPFAGSEQIAWSPEGEEIAYTIKDVENWAESTNSDVYIANLKDLSNSINVSEGMLGYDNDPVYSPDGRYLLFHSMERPGFESDRNRIMLADRKRGSIRDLTEGLDQMAHSATWLPDSSAVLFTSEFRGTTQIFKVALDGSPAKQISHGQFNWNIHGVSADGNRLLVSSMSMLRPLELGAMDLSNGDTIPISNINGEYYEDLKLPIIEERWVDATDGKKIHCWVIKPPQFDASKKYPLLTYCQGGPQGQIGQWFSYRWNFHLMAAQGYVIVAPNRRGLPGFGREWNDQISGDWGGQCMQDILSATDNMLKEPYVDPERTGAIGASFGGYTVYWMMGNHEDRFKTMVAHCGVFNLESMYGATEELFFVNWDLGGPYWKGGEIAKEYDEFSPHKFVQNWKTPLLVIHGQKDFRVPVTQGMEAFTAAQVQGVPSRFLYFPDEGHWVMGPQNGVLWHRVFFEWLGRTCKPTE